MCIGAVVGDMMSEIEVMKNAIAALEGRMDLGYAKGIFAYDAWKKMLLDEQSFSGNEIYDTLFSKLLVQNDAMCCIKDGRSHAASYMQELSEKYEDDKKCLLLEIANHFNKVSEYAENMIKLIGEWPDTDKMLKNLANRKVREEVGKLIIQAKQEDEKALQKMNKLTNLYK